MSPEWLTCAVEEDLADLVSEAAEELESHFCCLGSGRVHLRDLTEGSGSSKLLNAGLLS